MPLRPRFGPLGVSDVVDALLCSSPRAQTPEAWSPCGTPLHGRIDLSRRLTDVTTLAFLHAQRGFCVRAICAARASQGSTSPGQPPAPRQKHDEAAAFPAHALVRSAHGLAFAADDEHPSGSYEVGMRFRD